MKIITCVLALAIAQCQAGDIGVISAIAAGNAQSDSAGHSYLVPQQLHDAGYSYPSASAVAQIPIPSYSSGPLQQEVQVVKIVEDHGQGSHSHANAIAPQPALHQHVKHIKVHHGLQSYPDQGHYSIPAKPQHVKVFRIIHEQRSIDHSVHHSIASPNVQHQAPQPVKVIKVFHENGPVNHGYVPAAEAASISSGWASTDLSSAGW